MVRQAAEVCLWTRNRLLLHWHRLAIADVGGIDFGPSVLSANRRVAEMGEMHQRRQTEVKSEQFGSMKRTSIRGRRSQAGSCSAALGKAHRPTLWRPNKC
jgi:hypothetical protein